MKEFNLVTIILLLEILSGVSLDSQSWIRVNQLGYTPTSVKVAVFVSREQTAATTFQLVDGLTGETVFTGKKLKDYGPYGPFRSSYRLDFSAFHAEGGYYLVAGKTASPIFRISAHAYDGTADFLLRYMRQQRCGFNPFLNDSCHTLDGYIIYQPGKDSSFIDVVGGWHDATDYLQYVATTANAVLQMLFAWQQNPSAFGDAFDASGRPGKNNIPDILDEAGWGMRWLLKMNPDSGEMYNQVADDRDHIGFRLPTNDKANYGMGPERPVYYCNGKPQGIFNYKNRTTGIASTAGKFASAFALGALVWEKSDTALSRLLSAKARQAFWFGVKNPGACQTAPCVSPYFYEEDNWTDDLELAAAMLFQLTGENKYLDVAATYGRQEPSTPWMGADTARHYQWYPFYNLGHYYIAIGRWNKLHIENSRFQSNKGFATTTFLRPTTNNQKPTAKSYLTNLQGEFLSYWKQGIDKVYQRGKSNPFLDGIPFIWCSNNLTVAMLSQCMLYRKQSGDSTYAEMEAALRDWLFGCNPWGTSMIVGLPAWGDYPSDPHSSLSHLYHYKLDGGLVDGPVYTSIYNNLKGIYLANGDVYKDFQSNVAVYHDDYADYSTNEPTMDGTADLTYCLSALQSEANPGNSRAACQYNHGAIVRGDTAKKQLALVFTGHEFAEGFDAVKKVLDKHHIKAAFFFTGDFYRNPAFASIIDQLKKEGHYLGAHSDKHLLYCDWANRDSLLVTKQQFLKDIRANYAAMLSRGIPASKAKYFLPPYEWHNDSIAAWCVQLGLTLVNFSPGTSSNQDWTYPELGKQYQGSDSLYHKILDYQKSKAGGLNGFLLLTHFGTDPRRTDKFYDRLDELVTSLEQKGYSFAGLPALLGD